MIALGRGISAGLVSALISLVTFLLLGVFLPIWTMMLVNGRQNVQDAPCHGGIILLLTLPVAGVLALGGFVFLTLALYRRFSTPRGNWRFIGQSPVTPSLRQDRRCFRRYFISDCSNLNVEMTWMVARAARSYRMAMVNDLCAA